MPRMGTYEAIVRGIEQAQARGLTKPYDVALCIAGALSDAGFRIVRKPFERGGGAPQDLTPPTQEKA